MKKKAKKAVQTVMFSFQPNERPETTKEFKREEKDVSNLGIGDGKNFADYIKKLGKHDQKRN